MIMNRLRLKIVGCVVVVLVAAIAVYVFWPASRPVAESKDNKQVQKPAEKKLATEAKPLRGKLQRPRPKRAAAPTRFRSSKAADYRRPSALARKAYRQLVSRSKSTYLPGAITKL